MQKSEVKLGGVYTAKVTNKLVPVRIDAESRYGGWDATNIRTGKKVRIKSAQRLRGKATVGDTAATGAKKGKGGTKTKAPTKTPKAPTVVPTGEADAKPESTPGVCPNCGSTEVDEDGDCAKCREPNVADKEATSDKAKKPRAKKAKTEKKPKRLSGLDAAARVLEETGEPMNVKQIVELAEQKNYWKSPGGKTPHATVYSAIIREIGKQGAKARFRKAERGRFVHA